MAVADKAAVQRAVADIRAPQATLLVVAALTVRASKLTVLTRHPDAACPFNAVGGIFIT